MDNFNVTESPNNLYSGKESQSLFSEAYRDMQGNDNSLQNSERGELKKPLPQGFPELTFNQEQLGDAGPMKDPGKGKIAAELGNKKGDYSDKNSDKKEGIANLDKKEGIERLEKKEGAADGGNKKKPDSDEIQRKKQEELKLEKERELNRQKKEEFLNGGQIDKTKVPSMDGGTKDGVNSQSSGKPAGLEGGPKDKPAPAGQATNDSASDRGLTPAPDKVVTDGGPKSKDLTDENGSTPAPDKVVQDGGPKSKVLTGESELTPAPDKIVNEDGGLKEFIYFEPAPTDADTLDVRHKSMNSDSPKGKARRAGY